MANLVLSWKAATLKENRLSVGSLQKCCSLCSVPSNRENLNCDDFLEDKTIDIQSGCVMCCMCTMNDTCTSCVISS